jgi:hypothetical protein
MRVEDDGRSGSPLVVLGGVAVARLGVGWESSGEKPPMNGSSRSPGPGPSGPPARRRDDVEVVDATDAWVLRREAGSSRVSRLDDERDWREGSLRESVREWPDASERCRLDEIWRNADCFARRPWSRFVMIPRTLGRYLSSVAVEGSSDRQSSRMDRRSSGTESSSLQGG